MLRRACLILAVLILIGCDRPPSRAPSTQPDNPRPAANAATRPTLAQIMAEPRKTLQLSPAPLALEVPQSWQLAGGEVTFLQGKTPNGPEPEGIIHILVSRLPSFSAEMVSALETEEKRIAAEPKRQIKTSEFRPLGPVKLFEKRWVEPANPATGVPERMRWTFTVYVPQGNGRFAPYQLNFIDLTTAQYDKDRELLHQIVSTLRYEPASAGPVAP